MNLFNSREIELGIGTLFSTILERVWELVYCSNGVFPVTSSKASTPIAQMSTLASCKFPFNISGERQSRVPQKVFLRDYVATAHPKSAILMEWSETNIFQGLMSLWMIPLVCRQQTPWHSCSRIRDIRGSGKGPLLCNSWQSCPLGAYSRIRLIEEQSQKYPNNFSTLG